MKRINFRKKKLSRDRAREGGRERKKGSQRKREMISYSLSECSTQIKSYLAINSDDPMSALANAASQWKQQSHQEGTCQPIFTLKIGLFCLPRVETFDLKDLHTKPLACELLQCQ